MDIGTGKITGDEMQNIKHYMLDILAPDEKYSGGECKKQAEQYIGEMIQRKKIPRLG